MGRVLLLFGFGAVTVVGAAVLFALLAWNDAVPGPSQATASTVLHKHSIGPSCGNRAWPYYEPGCLRDLREPDGQARAARVITAQ